MASHLVDVHNREGVVALEGTVDNLLAKERATANAEAIRGVRAVINRITVSPLKRPDDEIARDIQWALMRNHSTDCREIQVRVQDQIATLTGTVDSWQQKELAGDIAQGIRGLSGLENKIDINYETQRADPQVAADIRQRLESDTLVDASRIKLR